MSESLAWIAAIGGLLLGGSAALVPGFPGSAVALLGLVAFAGLTDFQVLGREALILATLIALAGAVAQIASPAVASRAAGGTAGAATGAAIGAIAASFVPIPGAGLVGAALGAALLGAIGFREGVIRAIRGVFGAAGGCFLAVAADFVAVLGLGAVLALAAFLHQL